MNGLRDQDRGRRCDLERGVLERGDLEKRRPGEGATWRRGDLERGDLEKNERNSCNSITLKQPWSNYAIL